MFNLIEVFDCGIFCMMFMNYFCVDKLNFQQSMVSDYRLTLSWMFLEAIVIDSKHLLHDCNPFKENIINISEEDFKQYELVLKIKEPNLSKRKSVSYTSVISPTKKNRTLSSSVIQSPENITIDLTNSLTTNNTNFIDDECISCLKHLIQ